MTRPNDIHRAITQAACDFADSCGVDLGCDARYSGDMVTVHRAAFTEMFPDMAFSGIVHPGTNMAEVEHEAGGVLWRSYLRVPGPHLDSGRKRIVEVRT